MEFTHKELLEVPCVHCEQAVGQPCVAPGNRRTPILGFHKERSELRTKLPMIEMEDLDATEKSLVMGYGFLILCDSVASKSMEIFGKQVSGREVQQFFAAKAIGELKADGLIGKLKKKAKPGIALIGRCPECMGTKSDPLSLTGDEGQELCEHNFHGPETAQ